MIKGLVSILIPCYNGEKYIDRCFSSILSQTYKNIEVIVVDDGSTDNSLQTIKSKVERFRESSISIIIVSQLNRGLGGAIDTGLKYINGEFLLLLDIDDLLLPTAVESCINAFSEEIAIVRGNGYYVYDDSIDKIIKCFTDTAQNDVQNSLFEGLVYGTAYNWAGSYMVRTEKLFDFYKDKCIYPSRFGQNLQILMPIAYNNKDVFIDTPLMKYVQRKNSLSKSPNLAKNYLGYMDIRFTLIDAIVMDEGARESYKKAVRLNNNHYLLELFCISNDMKNAKERLKMLKSDKDITWSDRRVYYKYKLKALFRKNKGAYSNERQ